MICELCRPATSHADPLALETHLVHAHLVPRAVAREIVERLQPTRLSAAQQLDADVRTATCSFCRLSGHTVTSCPALAREEQARGRYGRDRRHRRHRRKRRRPREAA